MTTFDGWIGWPVKWLLCSCGLSGSRRDRGGLHFDSYVIKVVFHLGQIPAVTSQSLGLWEITANTSAQKEGRLSGGLRVLCFNSLLFSKSNYFFLQTMSDMCAKNLERPRLTISIYSAFSSGGLFADRRQAGDIGPRSLQLGLKPSAKPIQPRSGVVTQNVSFND